MSEFAIRTEGLSKQYHIGKQQDHYKTLRDTLTNIAFAPVRLLGSKFSRAGSRAANDADTIWALKDVSCEIKHGEVVGIIGSNGAGKSTLLKVLSRITEPTEGYADITGRIGSLLEVGTGFHPELTGRENTFLNGAILGMRKKELDRKFDEIVAFAEIERFVDTPVKHYSTGMYLRLAFAVAAHLEPNILLIDEVLAVGDATFQKKCLGKMGDVAKEGRTVLFVSHNMGAIRSLCNKGIVLSGGQVLHAGDVSKSVEAYYRSIGFLRTEGEPDAANNGSRNRFGPIIINGRLGNSVVQSEGFEVSTTLRLDPDISGFSIFCSVEYVDGVGIAIVSQDSSNAEIASFADGTYTIKVKFPPLWLSAGVYSVCFKVFFRSQRGDARHISDMFPLDVIGESSLTQALLQPDVSWSFQPKEPRDLERLSTVGA